MAIGRSLWESVYLGMVAAACQVGRIGNIPLTVDDIIREIEKKQRWKLSESFIACRRPWNETSSYH